MPYFGMCNGQRRVPLFLVQGIEEGHLPCLHLYKCQVQTLHHGPSFNPHPQSSVHQTPVFHPILRGTPLSLHPIQRYRNAWGVFLMNMNGCPAPDFLNLFSLSSSALNSSLPPPLSSSSSAAATTTTPSTQSVPAANLLKPSSPIPSASHLSATSPPVSSLFLLLTLSPHSSTRPNRPRSLPRPTAIVLTPDRLVQSSRRAIISPWSPAPPSNPRCLRSPTRTRLPSARSPTVRPSERSELQK